MRVHVDANGVALAVLANGLDGSFSTCWPIASRLVLDRFVDAWISSSGSTSSRLAASVRRSREQFVTAVPHLIGDEHIEFGPPSATLLAVAVEGASVHAVWIGGDEALLARGFEAVGRTVPHTLFEHFKREHPDQVHDLHAIPNVVVRSFGPRADQDPPEVAVFDAQAYEPDPGHGAWLGAWARTERALPVSFDMGGLVGLRRDGSVVSVAWDDPGSTREETSDAAHLAATIGATRNYPALRTLAPVRPPHAKACPRCEEVRVSPGGADGCPMC